MVKQIHPRLKAVRWVSNTYYIEYDDPPAHSIWVGARIELESSEWYKNIATLENGIYTLKPVYKQYIRILEELEYAGRRLHALHHPVEFRYWMNNQELHIKARGHDKFIWYQRIFVNYDDCHNPITPTTDFLVKNFEEAYEHFCTRH